MGRRHCGARRNAYGSGKLGRVRRAALVRDEVKGGCEYVRLGFVGLARDEFRHAEFLRRRR